MRWTRAGTLDGVPRHPTSALAPTDRWTVGAAAARTGVTVRTLHHWDAIGLVRPSERTAAGYRSYTAGDLARMHRVLVYRELGVPLDRIGDLLAAPADDGAKSLARQRDDLRERIGRLEKMADALDRLVEARASGILLSGEEQVAIFGEHWRPAWVGQARERWGDNDQWAQYAERAAQRSADDWRVVADEAEVLTAELADALRGGVLPGSAAANRLAERHRASLGEYFECSLAMHVCLGRMYVADPEFAAHYERIEPGLAGWLRDVVAASAQAQGLDPDTATWT